jgi:hypothetical protein
MLYLILHTVYLFAATATTALGCVFCYCDDTMYMLHTQANEQHVNLIHIATCLMFISVELPKSIFLMSEVVGALYVRTVIPPKQYVCATMQ